MKKAILAAGIVVLILSPIAQAGSAMKPDALIKLVDRLTLTEQQKTDIAEIKKATAEENAEFFKTSEKTLDDLQAAREANDNAKIEELKLTVQSQREELNRIREAELERIMDALTREQHIQFEELKAAREARSRRK